jgi:hypothetical protein
MKKALLLFFITALPLFGSDLNYTIEHLSDGTEAEAKTLESENGYELIISRNNNSFNGDFQMGSVGEYVFSSIEYNTVPEVNISESITASEDTKIYIPFSFFDTEGDDLNITILKNGLKGYLSQREEGFTYSPFKDLNGYDFVTVQFDDGFDGIIEKNISIVIKAVDDIPILADISDISMEEGSRTETISLSVSDVDSFGNPSFFVSSSNLEIADITTSGTSLKITPKNNKSGTSKISVTAYLGGSKSETQTFSLNISPVDDLPVFETISDVLIEEDSGEKIISFSLSDIDSDISKATYSINSSNTEIADITLSGNNIKIIPKENMFGKSEVTITANLDGKTVTENFSLSVVSVDDILILNKFSDITRQENSKTYIVPIYISDIDSDISKAQFSLNSSNPSLADVKITESGISITPKENQFGETEITLTASLDNQEVSETFKYRLTSFNIAPEIIGLSDLSFETSVNEIVEILKVELRDDVEVTKFVATSLNPEFVSVNANLESSELTLKISKEAVGKTTITVLAEDSEGEKAFESFFITVSPNQSQVCLEKAKTTLDFSKISGENSNQNYITKDLNLIKIIDDCDEIVLVTWKSSQMNIISDSGKVTLDKEKDFTVQLLALLKSENFTTEKTFLLSVPKDELSNEVILERAKENLTFQSIKNGNNKRNEIYSNLDLYTVGVAESTITWNSSNHAISDSGVVSRGETDTPVTLTATITKGELSTQKSFVLNVRSIKDSDSEIVESDFNWLTTSRILADNRNGESIKTALSLISTGANGSTISWTSSNSQIISTSGTVLRNEISDTYVQIIANIQSGDISKEKSFLLKVIKEVPNSEETIYSFNRIENATEDDKNVITLFMEETNSSQEVSSVLKIASNVPSDTEVLNNTLKTTIDNNSSLTTILLNSDGTTETRVETENGVSDVSIQVVDGKTEVNDNGDIVIENEQNRVTLKSDGSVSHFVNQTVAKSKLAGSSVHVSENGVETKYKSISKNSGGEKIILEAMIKTNNHSETETSFSLTNLTTGEKIDLEQTLAEGSTFSDGSEVEIDIDEEGEVKIKISTELIEEIVIN